MIVITGLLRKPEDDARSHEISTESSSAGNQVRDHVGNQRWVHTSNLNNKICGLVYYFNKILLLDCSP